MLKKIRVEDSVGLKIGHDMTRVIPGVFKDAAFKRGHVVTSEDIKTLLDMGKKYIFIDQEFDGLVHEEEAARRLAIAFSGPELQYSDVKQGRINVISNMHGLLKINLPLLREINSIKDIVLAIQPKAINLQHLKNSADGSYFHSTWSRPKVESRYLN